MIARCCAPAGGSARFFCLVWVVLTPALRAVRGRKRGCFVTRGTAEPPLCSHPTLSALLTPAACAIVTFSLFSVAPNATAV